MANTKGEAFDYKKFAEAIVYAQQEAEFLRQKEQEKLARKQQQEWLNVLGQKTYTKENRITRILHRWRNDMALFFKIIFLPQKETRGDIATFGIIHIALICIFSFIKWLCYFLMALLFFSAFYSFTDRVWTLSIWLLPCAFVCFVFARIIRVAVFEIEKMNDRNYLLSILSAVTALIAMIIALVALFLEVKKCGK